MSLYVPDHISNQFMGVGSNCMYMWKTRWALASPTFPQQRYRNEISLLNWQPPHPNPFLLLCINSSKMTRK